MEPSDLVEQFSTDLAGQERLQTVWLLDYPRTGQNLMDAAFAYMVDKVPTPIGFPLEGMDEVSLLVSVNVSKEWGEQFSVPFALLRWLFQLNAQLCIDILRWKDEVSTCPPLARLAGEEWLIVKASYHSRKRSAVSEAIKDCLANGESLSQRVSDQELRLAIKPRAKKELGMGSRLRLDFDSIQALTDRGLGLRVAVMAEGGRG